jgi:hypothetical protein
MAFAARIRSIYQIYELDMTALSHIPDDDAHRVYRQAEIERTTGQLRSDYNGNYKAEALVIRDVVLATLPVGRRNNTIDSIYSQGAGPASDVQNIFEDLERLARMLPQS